MKEGGRGKDEKRAKRAQDDRRPFWATGVLLFVLVFDLM
jgi:hypothetical protein